MLTPTSGGVNQKTHHSLYATDESADLPNHHIHNRQCTFRGILTYVSRLSHLQALEAESINIIREVASEFQRPELWNIFNGRVEPGESIRVFPLSNWTEMDVWQYIHVENIPIVPLYFAKDRQVLVRGNSLIVPEQDFVKPQLGDRLETVRCRMRSLGCSPCTGAVRSEADTLPKIIAELVAVRNSERENRVIDHDREGSMEIKKREGYF